ncbi:MAG: erythromycin esterase family protein [Myxococcales bacterium]|nr:erythromycin esterase family protein [Myxococcales bacterium]
MATRLRAACVVGIAAIGLSCSSGASSPSAPSAPKHAGLIAVTQPAPSPRFGGELDLGFEAGAQREPWTLGVGDAATQGGIERVGARTGSGVLRLTSEGGRFGAAAVTLDATAVRGQRVRLRGWVRTEAVVSGAAGLWLRVDDGRREFDDMKGRGLTGTAEWRAAAAWVDVPADAQRLVVGAMLVGDGTAWFDDLAIETQALPLPDITVRGRVIDEQGAPVAGAAIALVQDRFGGMLPTTVSDADGRFAVVAPPGEFALSAVGGDLVGAYIEERAFVEDSEVAMTLPRAGGVEVSGVVTGDVPVGAQVVLYRDSRVSGDWFSVPVGGDGRYRAVIPAAAHYGAFVRTSSAFGHTDGDAVNGRVRLDVAVSTMTPAPAAVSEWIDATALRVASADPAHDLSDLEGVAKLVGNARVVGLGEATHGTREFFQLKHRLVRYLVERMGFTMFAIEANQPECRAINDYVVRGVGDPRVALAGIRFWTWNTEEVLALIEWMRSWNADPTHRRKVEFAGIDMQYTAGATASVTSFVRRVAAGDAAMLALIEGLADPSAERLAAALAGLSAGFAKHARRWRGVDRAAYELARQDLRILEQEAAARDDATVRDAAMAENLAWLLAQSPKGTRAVVWAHNGHVARRGFVDFRPPMGHHLRARFGAGYLPIGFAFDHGSFQATAVTMDHGHPVTEHRLGPASELDVAAPFTRVGSPIAIVDLRTPPRGAVADWLAAPHPIRDAGSGYASEEAMTWPQALAQKFDALVYVRETTRARPLPAGLRPRLDAPGMPGSSETMPP